MWRRGPQTRATVHLLYLLRELRQIEKAVINDRHGISLLQVRDMET